MWLVDAILDSTVVEQVHHPRKFSWIVPDNTHSMLSLIKLWTLDVSRSCHISHFKEMWKTF